MKYFQIESESGKSNLESGTNFSLVEVGAVRTLADQIELTFIHLYVNIKFIVGCASLISSVTIIHSFE